jgi:hypothetical protein
LSLFCVLGLIFELNLDVFNSFKVKLQRLEFYYLFFLKYI